MSPEQATYNYARYAADPYAFLTECCFTKDQVDKDNPVKLIPDWKYLKYYVRIWQKYRLLAVPKSRRMTMSWTNIALFLHDAIFNRVRSFAFVSKKEEDAGELVKRAEFIFDHLPGERIPLELLPKKQVKAQVLAFPELDTVIQGYPMSADQLRQFTFSGILGDECAFWPDAEKFYSASYPTVEGGGRMNLISSRCPGFFQKLVYDQLDNQDIIDETPPVTPHYPLGDDSIMFWINPKNKFAVFDLHYTANPRKRDPAFREAVRSSMPVKEFMVEYERNWEAFDGKPVFEDYSKAVHETKSPNDPHLGLPIMCGWDFGLTPACVAAQLRGGQLFLLREFVAEHASIEKFAPYVMETLMQLFPEWRDQKKDYLHFIDPAGLDPRDTDARTCAGVMHEQGLRNIAAGPMRWEARRKAVEHFLLRRTKDGPAFRVYPPHCPVLVKGFTGGYRYPERYTEVEPDGSPRPVKNRYSHPHDALQYLCGGARSKVSERSYIIIPTPEYAFGGATAGADLRKRELGLG